MGQALGWGIGGQDENVSIQSNIQAGLVAMVFFFLIISIMAFPNGPFTRPHPAVWRIVFGLSILYMLLLLFIIFQTTTGKLKRAVLQFTPESWTAMRWLDPACTYMRFLAVSQLVVFWQLSELNTFFLKHIFQMPPSHPLVFIRIFLLGAMSAPTIRQFYSYVTDPRCKRVGTQCWVYGLCMCIESLICIKFGADIFQHTQIRYIILWILVQAAMSVMCVYVCVTYHRWQRRRQVKKDDSVDDETEVEEKVNSYIQSLPRKTVTLSTPEDEDSDDEGEDAASKVPRRRKNHHHLRRGNRCTCAVGVEVLSWNESATTSLIKICGLLVNQVEHFDKTLKISMVGIMGTAKTSVMPSPGIHAPQQLRSYGTTRANGRIPHLPPVKKVW
ncbi:Phosphatidylserine synthase 1 [Portunus trituberculatus]|uniref:Phosphatidylserine synthase n=1 Tax=Portunus trituberculatus TaxID=210409 RepID=A0A5B7EN03_PORTR|nr:Phosphatidylserine synthase 1 [Portunus trituberculatus]